MESNKQSSISNKMQNFGLVGLSAIEQNLWWALASQIKDKGTSTITLSREEIYTVSNYSASNRSIERFRKDMRSMGRKIVSLNTGFTEIDQNTGETADVMFSIFPVYKVYDEKIVVKVSEYFEPWFNNLNKNFTLIDFSIVVRLRSKYSKELYRLLMQYRNSPNGSDKFPGHWIIKYDKFRELFGVPKRYNLYDLKNKILYPAMEELTKKNKNQWAPLLRIKMTVKYEMGSKRKIDTLIFDYKVSESPRKLIAAVEKQEEIFHKNLSDVSTKAIINSSAPFKNGYVDGQNMNAEKFKKWLDSINFYNSAKNNEYFNVRSTAKKHLINAYSELVLSDTSGTWTNMIFLACVEFVIKRDKMMYTDNIEDSYNKIKGIMLVTDLFDTNIINAFSDNELDELHDFLNIN